MSSVIHKIIILLQPEDREWIALWVEVPKEKPDIPYHRRGRRDLLNNTYSIEDNFIEDQYYRLEQLRIGDNKENWHGSILYRNAALKPGKPYRIGLTAENSAGPAHLYYSAPIYTMNDTDPGYYAAIIVPILVVFGVAIAAAYYFYKRRDKYIDQNKPQIRHPYDQPQLQSSGVENLSFKMDRVDKKSKVIQLAEFMETYQELKQATFFQ